MTDVIIEKSFYTIFWDTDSFRNFLKSIKMPYRIGNLTYIEKNYIFVTEFIVSISGTSPAAINQLMDSISRWS